MKPSTVSCLSALAAPGLAASIGISNVRDHSFSVTDALKVPGESPVEFCNAVRDNDLVVVDKLSTSPNPVKPGKTALITASLDVKRRIIRGAYIKVVVKYGLIQLLATTADLCEQVEQVGLSCPLEAGKHVISQSVDMPSIIPPGTYNVVGDAYSDDDEHITCLRATVNFPHSQIFDIEL